jgi:hypothetical protein
VSDFVINEADMPVLVWHAPMPTEDDLLGIDAIDEEEKEGEKEEEKEEARGCYRSHHHHRVRSARREEYELLSVHTHSRALFFFFFPGSLLWTFWRFRIFRVQRGSFFSPILSSRSSCLFDTPLSLSYI